MYSTSLLSWLLQKRLVTMDLLGARMTSQLQPGCWLQFLLVDHSLVPRLLPMPKSGVRGYVNQSTECFTSPCILNPKCHRRRPGSVRTSRDGDVLMTNFGLHNHCSILTQTCVHTTIGVEEKNYISKEWRKDTLAN